MIRKSLVFLALFGSSLAVSAEEKPKLTIYTYEQEGEEGSTEVVFMTEFPENAPSTQPHAELLGVAETLQQSAAHIGKDLTAFFAETEQPHDISEHISQMDRAVKARFILPQEHSLSGMALLMDLIEQVPSEIGAIDRVIHEEMKSALLDSVDGFDRAVGGVASDALNQKLFAMAPLNASNHFMKENFSKAEHFLMIAYPKNHPEIKKLIDSKAEALKNRWEITQQKAASKVTSASSGLVKKKIDKSSDGFIVDGKIYMDSPRWWQTQSTGTAVGVGLLITGIVLGIASFGLLFLAIGIPGIILLCQSYLADPSVVENMRQQIFKNGFHYANAKQCVGLTLTPYERRYLFIKEIFDRQPVYVTKISDFAAYYVLKSYNYNSVEMEQFLYSDEKGALKTFQSNFYQSLKGIDQRIKELKAELASMLIPYQSLRDTSTELAYYDFENNAYVLQKEIYAQEHEEAKKAINKEYQKSNLTLEERNTALKDIKKFFDQQIAALDPYIVAAEYQLELRLTEIDALYDAQVLSCKVAINYEGRMKQLENAEWEIVSHYSGLVVPYIMQVMNSRENSFPDFLDLRSKQGAIPAAVSPAA